MGLPGPPLGPLLGSFGCLLRVAWPLVGVLGLFFCILERSRFDFGGFGVLCAIFWYFRVLRGTLKCFGLLCGAVGFSGVLRGILRYFVLFCSILLAPGYDGRHIHGWETGEDQEAWSVLPGTAL